MIRILVVDDSAFMRRLIADLLNAAPGLTVVDTARNGLEALGKIREHHPDVITMDIEMPGLDGLTTLRLLMAQCPTPVVMLSSLTKTSAEVTFKALELGAVDFVAKTSGPVANVSGIGEELIDKVRAAAKANLKATLKPETDKLSPVSPLMQPTTGGEKVVAIGTSTGGPRALQEVLTKIPARFPSGLLIVQHMPPGFTKSLAERLNSLSAIEIKEAEQGDVIRPGLALIAPGDYHMRVERSTNQRMCVRLSRDAQINGHRPSVDPLFLSVAEIYKKNAVGVILTGMGHDGTSGLKAIKERGGYTIAEDQSTAIVYGMPRSAKESGAVDKVVPLPLVASTIINYVVK